MLILANKMKDETEVPKFVQEVGITSIYKNKGSKLCLENERGIFSVSKVRSIVDKLIYNDINDIVDSNMSDSNVGGRKKMNIRDNLFVVYGIINFSLNQNLEVDITSYDLKQCFDSMWKKETLNDFWNVGINDNKFSLVSKLNKSCDVEVDDTIL